MAGKPGWEDSLVSGVIGVLIAIGAVVYIPDRDALA
jgi:hypothetical protein